MYCVSCVSCVLCVVCIVVLCELCVVVLYVVLYGLFLSFSSLSFFLFPSHFFFLPYLSLEEISHSICEKTQRRRIRFNPK